MRRHERAVELVRDRVEPVLVQQGVDLIIHEPLAPAPFAPAVDEAAKARLAGWAR